MIFFSQIAQIGYFFILFLFGSFIFLIETTGVFVLQKEMLYIYMFLLLPLLDTVYNMIFEEKSWKRIFLKKDSGLHILYFLMFLVFLRVLEIENLGIYAVSIISFFIFMRWDSRLFFAGALFTICVVIYYLLLGESSGAEQLSIYIYYFLVAGVIIEGAEGYILKK